MISAVRCGSGVLVVHTRRPAGGPRGTALAEHLPVGPAAWVPVTLPLLAVSALWLHAEGCLPALRR